MKVGTDAVLLGAWAKLPASGSVLDIGTGTGIIAMMIAQRSGAAVDAIEIESDAYEQAIENCSNSKWNERVKVHHMPLEEFTLGERKKYDLIISNPPFFINSLQPVSESRTKARHACTLTFEGLVEGTVSLLHPKGTFATILPIKESEDLINIARENNLNLIRITRIKTTASKPAKRVLMQFGFTPHSFSEDTLVIENEDHTYTDSYKELTRDFYLGF